MTSSSLVLGALASFLVVVSAPGCAADADDDSGAPREDIVAETDEAALAAMRYYDCRGGDGGDSLNRIEIGISATRFAVTDLSKDAVIPDMGTLDRAYRPGPQYTGAIRFDGFKKLVDSLSSDVAHLEVIASKELVAKAPQGKMWIRTSGSGGGSMSYSCKSKPAKLSVDPSRKARLACSFEHLDCKNINPPGSTCLADLFMNQTTSGAATIKLTYLDHFGVRATPRHESLGASSDLDRTKTKVTGAWGAHDLKLTYRGGVTYTGTFKLPGGAPGDVKCNDLAMFD